MKGKSLKVQESDTQAPSAQRGSNNVASKQNNTDSKATQSGTGIWSKILNDVTKRESQ
jgi:hypothetical protein